MVGSLLNATVTLASASIPLHPAPSGPSTSSIRLLAASVGLNINTLLGDEIVSSPNNLIKKIQNKMKIFDNELLC